MPDTCLPRGRKCRLRLQGHADDHVVFHHQRGHGGPITLFHIRDHFIPAKAAVFRIERKQVCVGSGEEEPSFIHGHAPVAYVVALFGGMIEVPDHVS